MQKINTFATLPYWDPLFEQGLPNPVDSLLWEPDFLGNGEGPVTSGPFAGWFLHPIEKHARKMENGINTTSHPDEPFLPLTRNMSHAGELMSPGDVEFILSRTEFRQFSACVDTRLEAISRHVHEWIGGSMYDVYYSANDPLFFLFHAYLDNLWEEWRRNVSYEHRTTGYPPNFEACTKYHYANATMSPFEPLLNKDGLTDAYTRLYYTYQTSPTCSVINPNCLSPFLFCHHQSQRCLSKVRLGGDCTGLAAFDPCYQSKCVNGKCSPGPSPPVHGVQLLNGTDNAGPPGPPAHSDNGGPPGPPARNPTRKVETPMKSTTKGKKNGKNNEIS